MKTSKFVFALMALASLSLVATGCSVDKQIDEFAKSNKALVKKLKKTDSAEKAKKVYDQRIPKIKKVFGELKNARQFQMTKESKKQLTNVTVESVQTVCALKLRAAFNPKAKKVYGELCQDYADMLEISKSKAEATVMDKEVEVELFVESFNEAKKKVSNGEAPTAACASLDDHMKTGEKYGFEKRAKKFEKLCKYKGPYAEFASAVQAVEKAREENPDDSASMDCSSAGVTKDMVMEDLKENGYADKPEVKKLVKRYREACPE